jgi:phosphoribosylformylglycinamidine synthase
VLARRHRKLSIACTVVAPSLTPKGSGDKIKTDRRDARLLARLHRAGELTAVHIPDERDEAIRDLCRARTDAVHDLRGGRNQLKAFLLRNGYRYTETTAGVRSLVAPPCPGENPGRRRCRSVVWAELLRAFSAPEWAAGTSLRESIEPGGLMAHPAYGVLATCLAAGIACCIPGALRQSADSDMPAQPHALLIKFPGTNCDAETARALEAAGFSAEILPVALLEPAVLERAQMIVFSGGFSYGDYVMSGRIAQLTTKNKLGERLKDFVAKGGYALGICNGFQILTQLDLLPHASLIHNTSGRFICRWVGLKKNAESPFLSRLPAEFELPIAHAEGRVVADGSEAAAYVKNGRAALLYTTDVNGSTAAIAGLQDDTGRVFGLMPHPERFLWKSQHYDRDWKGGEGEWGAGYWFFKGAAEAMAA